MRTQDTYRANRRNVRGAGKKGRRSLNRDFKRVRGDNWERPFPEIDEKGEPFIKYRPKEPS